MTLCDNCGAEIPEESKFCTHCGAPSHTASPKNSSICVSCGMENKPESRFCVKCGNSLAHPAQSGVSDTHICEKCGAHNLESDKYCVGCGTALSSKKPVQKLEHKTVISQTFAYALLFTGMTAIYMLFPILSGIYYPPSYPIQALLHTMVFFYAFYVYMQVKKDNLPIAYTGAKTLMVWYGLYSVFVITGGISIMNLVLLAGHAYVAYQMFKVRLLENSVAD